MVCVFFTVPTVFHEVDFLRGVDFIAHGHIIGRFADRADHTNE